LLTENMSSIPVSTFIEQKWHGGQLLWHHFQKLKFMFSIPLRTCFKNCCYHLIVVSMEWCIYKVHCIDIAFYLQIKWDGSSEGECMLYMYEVLSPLSLCAKFTFAQLLLSRILILQYRVAWWPSGKASVS
jgi:hypothetical protein